MAARERTEEPAHPSLLIGLSWLRARSPASTLGYRACHSGAIHNVAFPPPRGMNRRTCYRHLTVHSVVGSNLIGSHFSSTRSGSAARVSIHHAMSAVPFHPCL